MDHALMRRGMMFRWMNGCLIGGLLVDWMFEWLERWLEGWKVWEKNNRFRFFAIWMMFGGLGD